LEASYEADFGKLSPQLWRLAEALGQPTSKPSVDPREELLPPGMIDFRQADLRQMLDIYASLANRTLL
jgi:hypothetical protein